MAIGPDTHEMLAIKLPHLAPIAEELNEALGTAKQANGGWATFNIAMQNGIVQTIDIMIRRFLKKDGRNKHCRN